MAIITVDGPLLALAKPILDLQAAVADLSTAPRIAAALAPVG